MMINRTLVYLPALLVGLALAAPPAHAVLMMTIDDLSTAGVDVEITDTNGDGIVTYNSVLQGNVGSWVSVSGGFGAPTIGNDYYDALDLFSVDVSGGAGTLVVSLTDTDFARTSAHFTSGVGGTTQGTASFATYLSESNTAFDTGSLLSSLGPYSGAFSGTDSKGIDVGDPYALTMVATITHTRAGQITSFDYFGKIPEPGPLALFGIGLVALAAVRRQASR